MKVKVLAFAGLLMGLVPLASSWACEEVVNLEAYISRVTDGRPSRFKVVYDEGDMNGDGLPDIVGIVHPELAEPEEVSARMFVLYRQSNRTFSVAANSKAFAYGDNTRDSVGEVHVLKNHRFKISFQNNGRYGLCGPNVRVFTFQLRDRGWQLIGEDYEGADENGCEASRRTFTNYSMNVLTGDVIITGENKGKKIYKRVRQSVPPVFLTDFDTVPHFEWKVARSLFK